MRENLPSHHRCGGMMRDLEIPDELWERIQPLLPTVPRRHRWPGRKRRDDRACLNGILFVLATGINWQDLPSSSGTAPG
jgi:transposase